MDTEAQVVVVVVVLALVQQALESVLRDNNRSMGGLELRRRIRGMFIDLWGEGEMLG